MSRKFALCPLIALLLLSLFQNTVFSRFSGNADHPNLLTAESAHLKFTPAEWQALHGKQIVSRALGRTQEKEMAGFGAMVAEAAPQEFFTAFETLAVFAKSETTLACGRFSAAPAPADLDKLPVNDKDLYALMHAQSQASDIKLAAADITRIQNAAGPQPLFGAKMRLKLTAEYKQLLLEKVRAYLETGDASLAAYVDQEAAVSPRDAFGNLLKAQAAIPGSNSQLFARLAAPPRQTESFVYWALQKFGKLRPVISLVHVMLYRDGHRSFIASKQIYSSHYTEAGLGIAELIPFSTPSGQTHTLAAYTIRLQVDLLNGSMGFMKKRMAQPQMLDNLKTSLAALRLTVETLRSAEATQQP